MTFFGSNIIQTLKYKFQNEIRYWPRSFKIGIKNLIVWFPIVWKDRQWDHQYIYTVFRHKLNLTEQFIRHNGIHVNNIADADKIKKCVILLDRLMKDEYHENVFKNHYKKWGEPNMDFKDCDENPELSVLDIKYPHVKTEEDDKKQTKDFRIKSKMEAAMREQDLDMLFKLMRKHIQSWWD